MQLAQTRMGDSIAHAKMVTLVTEHHALQTSARLITTTLQKLAQMVLYSASMELRLARQETVNVAAQMDLLAAIVTNALPDLDLTIQVAQPNVSLAQTSRQTTKSLTLRHVLTNSVRQGRELLQTVALMQH